MHARGHWPTVSLEAHRHPSYQPTRIHSTVRSGVGIACFEDYGVRL